MEDELIAAATKLFARWKGYRETNQGFEDAYYKLAKFAYYDWQALEKAIEDRKQS